MSLFAIQNFTLAFLFSKIKNYLLKNTPEGNWVLLVRTSSIIVNWNLKGAF